MSSLVSWDTLLGKPEDTAKVALFLASDLSNHITGEGIIVSAGDDEPAEIMIF